MKLDVLDGFPKIKICVAYELNGERINYVPTSLENVKAAQEEFEILSRGVFKNKKVGLLHGRMKSKEKEEIGICLFLHSFKYHIIAITSIIQ